MLPKAREVWRMERKRSREIRIGSFICKREFENY